MREHLESLNPERMSLTGEGAVLEKGIVYIAPLIERLELLPSLSGAANPKSSTGRLDIFTRLIVDRSEAFDDVRLGYHGPLWVEISPRSFSVRVQAGSRLNQIRFRSRNSKHKDSLDFTLKDDEISRGTPRHAAGRRRSRFARRPDLPRGSGGPGGPIVGYRAQKNGDIIDVDRGPISIPPGNSGSRFARARIGA